MMKSSRRNSSFSSPTPQPSRRSKRCITAQFIQTKKLRRLNQLFWEDDSFFQKQNSDKLDYVTTKSESEEESQVSVFSSSSSVTESDRPAFTFGRLQLHKIHDSPHIYTINNFLTGGELKHLEEKIRLAERHDMFEQSFVDGPDGNITHGKKSTTPSKTRQHSKKRKRSEKNNKDAQEKENILRTDDAVFNRKTGQHPNPIRNRNDKQKEQSTIVVSSTINSDSTCTTSSESNSSCSSDEDDSSFQEDGEEVEAHITCNDAMDKQNPQHDTSSQCKKAMVLPQFTIASSSEEDIDEAIRSKQQENHTDEIISNSCNRQEGVNPLHKSESTMGTSAFCSASCQKDHDIDRFTNETTLSMQEDSDIQKQESIDSKNKIQYIQKKDDETCHVSESPCTADTNLKSNFNDRHNVEQDEDEIDDSPQRTSNFIHFSKLSNAKIAAIENRAADLLSLPNHSIEPLQLVKYAPGQYFKKHHDLGELFDDGSIDLPSKSAFSPPRRLVTILVYLNDVPPGLGGETQFPLLKGKDGVGPLKVSPKRGTALVWCNILKNGLPDQRVVHSGQPIKHICRPTPPRRNYSEADGRVSCQDAVLSISTNQDMIDALDEFVDNVASGSKGSWLESGKRMSSDEVIKYAMNIWACEE